MMLGFVAPIKSHVGNGRYLSKNGKTVNISVLCFINEKELNLHCCYFLNQSNLLMQVGCKN